MYQLVPVVAILCTLGLPVAAFIYTRYLRHQERMELLRRGIVPPPQWDKHAYKAWRKSGGAWPPPGRQWTAGPQAPFGQPQAPFVQPGMPGWTAPEDDPQCALKKGIRVALIGLALTIGLGSAFGGYAGNPAILGGLIPMFVGIAQIIIALLSGAQLPGVGPRTTFIPPPPRPGAPPPPPAGGYGAAPPPPGGYGMAPPPWAEQPGRPRFEELSKPVPPPDVR